MVPGRTDVYLYPTLKRIGAVLSGFSLFDRMEMARALSEPAEPLGRLSDTDHHRSNVPLISGRQAIPFMHV